MGETSSSQAPSQNKQPHKHEAPKITFQKAVDPVSLDKHLGNLKLRGKKKQAVESYRKGIHTWRNPDTAPPPSFAPLPGNKRGGERYLKEVIKDHKANGHLAYHKLRNIGLQGKKRQVVEKYHREVVGDHMQDIPGAHSAVIKNLAHAEGSADPNIHISTKIKSETGNIILTPRLGDPTRKDRTHHIYTNEKNPPDGYAGLPLEYKKALDKKARREGKKPGVA